MIINQLVPSAHSIHLLWGNVWYYNGEEAGRRGHYRQMMSIEEQKLVQSPPPGSPPSNGICFNLIRPV